MWPTPSTWEIKAAHLCEFKASLGYIIRLLCQREREREPKVDFFREMPPWLSSGLHISAHVCAPRHAHSHGARTGGKGPRRAGTCTL